MDTQAITLLFAFALNASAQIGDYLYYTNDGGDTIVEIGAITSITENANGSTTVVAQIPVNVTPPVNSSYIFFAKESRANTSNLKGYYAEVQFRNDSTTEVELFSVGSEVFQSSK